MKPSLLGHTCLTREQRLGWARSVRSDLAAHSDARIRRACRIFLSETRWGESEDTVWAREMLKMLPTGAPATDQNKDCSS